MHAENLDSAVKRLTQKPMEISPAYIPLMNVVLSIQRVHLTKDNEKRAYRRVITLNEISDYEDYRIPFRWHPARDEHEMDLSNSALLSSIGEKQGVDKTALLEEIGRRKVVLHWMRERNIRSYKDVAAIVAEYYARPKNIYEKVLAGEELRVATSKET
jgi:flagellar protein FlaI